jgi:hypothetical protein
MVEELPLESQIPSPIPPTPISANQPKVRSSCRDPAQQQKFLRRKQTRLSMFRRPRKKKLFPRKGPEEAPGKAPGEVQRASTGEGATLPAPTPENEPGSLPGPKGALPGQTIPETIPEGGLPLVEAESRHCRWPVNPEGTDYRCCGAPKLFPYPYCEAHVARAFHKHQLEARGVFIFPRKKISSQQAA